MTPSGLSELSLASRIEHTALSATATAEAIERLCDEAISEGFFGVCVNPVHVALCVVRLAGSPVRVVTVVGFPLGMMLPESKAFETHAAVAHGAHEIDMVLRVDALKAGDDATVVADIAAVVAAAEAHPVKVILETGHLDDAEITRACRLTIEGGAQLAKTSTGFGPRGASVQDINLMRAALGPVFGIKASGGIRTRAQAEALVAAGADRLGTSSGIAIVRGA